MTQTNKPPEWWLPEFNEKFGWLYLNVSKITGSPNWLYVSGDVKDFIKQTLLTERAKTATDLKAIFNRCKTEKGISQALANYLKLLE